MRRVVIYVSVYLAAYFFASYLDLSTTALALHRYGTHEQNVFATQSGSYSSMRAWIITYAGALFTAACVAFAATYARRVDEEWLRHPARSFAKLYVNPWNPRTIVWSPLHMLSFAVALLVLRVLAAVNNLLIAWYGTAPIGEPIQWIGSHSSALIGFAFVLGPMYYALAIAVSPLCVTILRAWRTPAMRFV